MGTAAAVLLPVLPLLLMTMTLAVLLQLPLTKLLLLLLPCCLPAACRYMGLKQPRLRGDAYYEVVDEFVAAVMSRWPKAVLQVGAAWPCCHARWDSELGDKWDSGPPPFLPWLPPCDVLSALACHCRNPYTTGGPSQLLHCSLKTLTSSTRRRCWSVTATATVCSTTTSRFAMPGVAFTCCICVLHSCSSLRCCNSGRYIPACHDLFENACCLRARLPACLPAGHCRHRCGRPVRRHGSGWQAALRCLPCVPSLLALPCLPCLPSYLAHRLSALPCCEAAIIAQLPRLARCYLPAACLPLCPCSAG